MVLGIVLLPVIAKQRARGCRISCANNPKQISIAYLVWSTDNGGHPPSKVPVSQGGAMEDVERGSSVRYFQVMSNELGTPKILVCPEDSARRTATNFSSLQMRNISYFIAPDAVGAVSKLWLTGDRNLATNGVALKSGLFTMPGAQTAFSWTSDLHKKKGYIVHADGHIELTDGDGRAEVTVPLQKSATNALDAFHEARTMTDFRLLFP